MIKLRKSLYERITLGYSFGLEREAYSLVFISYFLIILFGVVVIILHVFEEDPLPVTYRYHGIIIFGLLNLLLLRKRLINIARIIILGCLPFLLLILPPLGGVLADEFYFWFPYVPIGLSIIPHFILHPERHRAALYITLSFYLLLSLFIDSYLILLSDGSEKIIPIVIENRFYYKLIPVFLFLFVNTALRLLFVKNYQFRTIMDDQQENLAQSEKMASMGILTSGLAHEINNPLNFISGSLHALDTLKKEYIEKDSELTPEKKNLLKQINQVVDKAFEGVNRATNIISKLTFFAHPEVSQEKVELNLNLLLQTALRSIESILPYYINLTTDIPKDLIILGHEQQLRLVFSHIIRNAIDALESQEEKKREAIYISAAKESHERRPYTRISFSNSGPAIPEESLKHIFDPFFSSRETGEGLGLGMSLSYMIIREHGGKMEVKNEMGLVKFNVYMPAWVE